MANQLKERLEALENGRPKQYKDYNIEVVRDQSVFIQAAVDTVEHHLIIGGALAAVIVFFFLANVRATVIAALSIPTSIVAAFAIVQYMGFTLNSLTLLALTLSVGIVIDDAIVVMENIFRFIEEKKYTPREAAIAATGEIGLAVMAITLSLIAVFLPIAMMEGIVGRFLKSFGITMAATILVSMLVSFTLTPMLAARWFKRAKEQDDDSPLPLGEGQGVRADGAKGERGQSDALTLTLSQRERGPVNSPRPQAGEGPGVRADGGLGEQSHHNALTLTLSQRESTHDQHGGSKSQVFYRAIESVYLVLLRFSLRNRWLVVLATVGCMATLPMLVKVLPVNFIPDEDSSEFQLSVQTPEGTSLGGDAGDRLPHRPRHPKPQGRQGQVYDCQRGRYRTTESLPGDDLRAAGQHRRPRPTANWNSWILCETRFSRSPNTQFEHPRQRDGGAVHVGRRNERGKCPVHDRRARYRHARAICQGRDEGASEGAWRR